MSLSLSISLKRSLSCEQEINCSVAATGKGGGCVLASATAHVAEPQHTLSLYYPLFTNRSFYRRISPTLKGIQFFWADISRRFKNSRVTFDEGSGQTCGFVPTLHQRSSGRRGKNLKGGFRADGSSGGNCREREGWMHGSEGQVCRGALGRSAPPKRLCPYTSQHQP